MKVMRTVFDRIDIVKKKISFIVIALVMTWFVAVMVFMPPLISFGLGIVAVVVIVIAVIVSFVLLIRIAMLMKQQCMVVADDKGVHISWGKTTMDMTYFDIEDVSYSFSEQRVYTNNRTEDAHVYMLSAEFRLKNGNTVTLTKNFGPSSSSHYSSAEEMTQLIGDRSEETALLAYVKTRLFTGVR